MHLDIQDGLPRFFKQTAPLKIIQLQQGLLETPLGNKAASRKKGELVFLKLYS